MSAVGYAWIQNALGTPDFLGSRQARLALVQRLQRLPEGTLLVPQRLAPGDSVLEQALFALKHEGVELGLLAAALRRMPPEDLVAKVQATPNSIYARKLGCLWEGLHGRVLPGLPETGVAAAYVPLFDPDDHVVGESRRDARWRIEFNGLGDWRFCPVVRKTPALKEALASDILGRAHDFAKTVGVALLERAMAWAYLSETEGSFAIEGEAPSHDKAARFAALLRQAHDRQPLTEELLVAWQNATVANPYDQAVQFRIEQNRLQNEARGAAGVTYVPPRPDLCAELMDGLMALANRCPAQVDPLVHAALVSFAFVFIHPFMDGNGRLSRFLIHYCLGQSGRLPPQFLLPVSVAMKRHEADYLQALTAFSKPARGLCQVTWGGEEHYSYEWTEGADLWFRTMDVTAGVEFTLAMADVALDLHLRQEVDFLALFDAVKRHIDEQYDLRGSDLSALIVSIHQNGGSLSNNRRKRYADRVAPQVLDAIERAVGRAMKGLPLADDAD